MIKEKCELIREAIRKYKEIYPTNSRDTLEDCFTVSNGKLRFWFNLKDGNTKMITRKIKDES